jgi:succinate-acetate transporter protein
MEKMEQKKIVVESKEWANPTPAGLVGLAVACICFFALLTGRVNSSAMPLIGCWLFGGFVIQIVVAVLDLKSGNGVGGNIFLYFSAFFMFVSGLEMFIKYQGIVDGAPLDGRIDGYAWCILTIVTLLWTPAFFKKFSLLSVVVVLIDIALPFIALIDIGAIPATFAPVPAWALLAAALVAVYLASAMVVNSVFGRKIYPIP